MGVAMRSEDPIIMRIRALLFLLAFAVTFPASASELGVELDRGVAAYRNGDITTAINIFRKLAEGGVSQAQYNLGVIYASGKGVPKDLKTSAKWHRLAADQGNADAQYNLGVYLEHGRGVTKNSKEALKYFRLAAEQGSTKAQYNVGVFNVQARGTEKDLIRGYKWLAIAASKGYEPAIDLRDIVKHIIDPAELAKAKKLSRDWMSKHPG